MASNLKGLFELALHIQKPWYIEDIVFDEPGKRLNIKINFQAGNKFFYEDAKSNIRGHYPVYDTTEKQWRHLNFFENECYLIARVPRIQTPDGHVRLIDAPWSGQQNGFTLLFEALALGLLEVMPVHRVGKKLGISDHKLWSLIEKYVTIARKEEDYSDVKTVGMDETSKRKHHDYITLFVDLDERKTLFVTEGRSHKTVEAFAKDLIAHHASPEQIADVSCDMSAAFIKGVHAQLPNAQITFDKFHVLKIMNEAVDAVRRAEVREQPELLRGKRFIFLKNRDNLTAKQRETLEELSLERYQLKTYRALRIREIFQQIYHADTQETFEKHLNIWCRWVSRSGLGPMKIVAEMIKARWDGIVRWKTSQINNGILEGLNSLIQAAKAKARGYKSFRSMALITYLLTAKLDFTVLNKYYLPT